MAIMLPFIQKDVFGGPAGSTRNAMEMLVQGILQGAAKRKEAEQNRLLSNRFADQSGQFGPPRSSEMFIESLFADPKLTPESKGMGLSVAKTMGDIDVNRAQAQRYRTPEAGKTKELEYWKPDGSYGSKVLVPESRYNDVVLQLEERGYTVQKPREESKETGEFERLLTQLEKSKRITPEQSQAMISRRIQKLIETGGESDETNKIVLGDGQKVTLAELRAQYREKYNIPDEFELQLMMISPDPAVKEQARKLKADAATKPSFVEFMEDARENGLEGLRPGGTVKAPAGTKIPPPPKGFTLD